MSKTDSEEQYVYYRFEPNGKAQLRLETYQQIPNNDSGRLVMTLTVDGNYIVEEGKALTVKFDRSKSILNAKFEASEKLNDLIAKKEKGAAELKAHFEKQFKEGATESLKERILLNLPLSYLYQIVCHKENLLILLRPVKGRSNPERIELQRVENGSKL